MHEKKQHQEFPCRSQAFVAASSLTCKTSWNCNSTRSKCVPSQNTFPQPVQMKYTAIRGRRPGGTVSSWTSAPLGNLKVWGSRAVRGAQRQWGVNSGPSGGLQLLYSACVSPCGSQSSRLDTMSWRRPFKSKKRPSFMLNYAADKNQGFRQNTVKSKLKWKCTNGGKSVNTF